MTKVAIVILNWNGKKFLQSFLPSVVRNSSLPEVEIYVADNGSTDDSVSYTQQKFPETKIIQLDKNYGFAEGYNRALNQIDATYYCLLNSDVEVTTNWLHPIISLLESDLQIAACMPKIKSYSQPRNFEYAGAAGGFIDYFGYPFCQGRILNHIEQDDGQYNTVREIFWATGACMFVRADLYKKFGGLDGDFFAHMEEIDFCWRMKNMGYKIMYMPEVEVFHVGGGTLPNNNPHKLFLNFRNNLWLLYKNLPEYRFHRTIIARMCFDTMAAFVYLASFNFSYFKSVFRAHIAFYKNLPQLRAKRKLLETGRIIIEHPEIYKKSIVISFFIQKIKIFSKLKFNSKTISYLT